MRKLKTEEQKESARLASKKFYEANKNKIKIKRKERDCKNRNKINETHKKYLKDNPEKQKQYNKKYRENNKDKKLNSVINWRKKNPNKNKEYYEKHKGNNKIKRKIYENNRLKTDYLYKLKHNIKTLIRNSFKINGYTKITKTHNILGCSYDELKQHLESKFESWMSWNNRGLYNGTLNHGWDIDHIIPLSSAITKDDIIRLNHYRNLQPLCCYTNRYIKKDNY